MYPEPVKFRLVQGDKFRHSQVDKVRHDLRRQLPTWHQRDISDLAQGIKLEPI